MQQLSILGIAIVCASMSLWLLLGLSHFGMTKTEGTVLASGTRIGQKGSTIYLARYSFLDARGLAYQGEGIVSGPMPEGAPVTVYYRASAPTVNQPARGYKDTIAGVVLLFLAGLAWQSYRHLRTKTA